MIFDHSPPAHKLHKQPLVLVAVIVGAFAITVSLFNWVMFAQNEFDPIIIEKELHKRRRAAAQGDIGNSRAAFKRSISNPGNLAQAADGGPQGPSRKRTTLTQFNHMKLEAPHASTPAQLARKSADSGGLGLEGKSVELLDPPEKKKVDAEEAATARGLIDNRA